MAGTMPHAVFVETGLDGGGTVAAYAAELPGCATFAATPDEAVERLPDRVTAFLDWLRDNGGEAPSVVGDNWYEVERSSAGSGAGNRATFSLDELPPSAEEWDRWLRWLELAREELAEAVDAAGDAALRDHPAIAAVVAQDEALAGGGASLPSDPGDRFYAVRDRLLAALEAAGPTAPGARRAVRLAIADDLRAAEQVAGGRP